MIEPGARVATAAVTDPASVLVIDDNATTRYIVGSWLRRAGHRVTEASTAHEGLALVGTTEVDVVILDVRLPDLSGYEVCERIKADPRTQALPVIHLSATAIKPEDRTQGLARGADAYLTEPVDPRELLATVDAVLRYYRARRKAELLANRLTALTATTLAVNAAETFDALGQAAAAGATRLFDSPAAVFLLTPDGRLRHAFASGPGQPPESHTVAADLLTWLTGQILGDAAGSGVVVVPAEAWATRVPWAVIRSDVRAVLCRTKVGRPAVSIAVPAATAFPETHDFLRQLGQTTALAVESLRAFTEEHDLALTLQRSFLPHRLPHHPEAEMAVRYIPASRHAEIGGDFYEVVEVDGRLLVVIGDVAGHSLQAATVMGEVRHALRAYAAEGHGPVAILDRLNELLDRFHPMEMVTLCILRIDFDADTVEVANAGHIPPLFIDDTGATWADVYGPVLGLPADRPEAGVLPFPPGTTVLLITDGLVEERDVSLDERLEALRVATLSMEDSLEDFSDRLIGEFGNAKDDDIALLALRRIRPAGPSGHQSCG